MMVGMTKGPFGAGTPMQGFALSHQDNMNGEYPLSKTPGGKASHIKRFADYPGGVESFEVYSPPMTTLYSQVWWTGLPPVDLPKDIVERFEGKGIHYGATRLEAMMCKNEEVIVVAVAPKLKTA